VTGASTAGAGRPSRSAEKEGALVSNRAVRTKPVRRSVDLSPTHHAMLLEWCAKAADELGVTRVTGQDVIRALVARLLMDQALARRIRADLRMNI
jgi:hypothetical protein